MVSAEKKCCRAQQGYSWSVKLMMAARAARYWKTRKSNILNKREDNNRIKGLGITLKIPYKELDMNDITNKLSQAWKNLQTAQRKAACLRAEFLEEMAQLYTTSGNTNLTSIIKNIKHREEVHIVFASLRYTAKGHQMGSVSTLKVPEEIHNNSS
eukprot:15026824-Ditylum_brightwellii.AAC.1